MLGLCARAGHLDSGEFSCEKSIKSGKACLCILASDVSDNTRKHFEDMCAYRLIRLIDSGKNKEEFGHVIGRKDRSVVTINDKGFADTVLRLYEGGIIHG